MTTEPTTCPHISVVNTTICKFCGRPQCDLCRKKHEEEHIANNDKELHLEDME